MSTDTTPIPDAAAPAEPPVKELTATLAKITAYVGAVKDTETLLRNQLEQRLLALHDETGTKSLTVKDDNGDELVTYTVVQPQASDTIKVTDPEAFLDWVLANFPTEVETITQVRPAFQARLLSRIVANGGVLYDSETGEPIEAAGVEHVHTPAGDPTGITTSWKRATKDKPSGKERALQWALTDGVPALPAIEAP